MMGGMTDGLVEFLLARIAEDEAVARAMEKCSDPLDWTEPGDPAVGLAGPVDGPSGYESIVIDPARVLAECEAKRQIIAQQTRRPAKDFRPTPPPADTPVLRLLAMPYVDHPDYRQEWRPEV